MVDLSFAMRETFSFMTTDPIRNAWRIRIGQNIRRRREHKGITLTLAARRLGWSSAKLSRIENGGQACTLDDLGNLARVLACPPRSLIAGRA